MHNRLFKEMLPLISIIVLIMKWVQQILRGISLNRAREFITQVHSGYPILHEKCPPLKNERNKM